MSFKVSLLICLEVTSLTNLHDNLMGSFNVLLQVRHAEVFLVTFVALYLTACVFIQNVFVIPLVKLAFKTTLIAGVYLGHFDLLFILLAKEIRGSLADGHLFALFQGPFLFCGCLTAVKALV